MCVCVCVNFEKQQQRRRQVLALVRGPDNEKSRLCTTCGKTKSRPEYVLDPKYFVFRPQSVA